MATEIPTEWMANSWEEKARQNALYAVQTQPDMLSAAQGAITAEHLDALFNKGETLFRRWLRAELAAACAPGPDTLVVEYGCGVGRVLKAVIKAGYRCIGVDISQTMLSHCRELVPEAEALLPVGSDGRTAVPDSAADFVFSYAVLQHIGRLSDYLAALREISRMIRPGGRCALHLNCGDYLTAGEPGPWRTENHEDHSIHILREDPKRRRRHDQNSWSGVYIGLDLLRETLAAADVQVTGVRPHRIGGKPYAVWVSAMKTPG